MRKSMYLVRVLISLGAALPASAAVQPTVTGKEARLDTRAVVAKVRQTILKRYVLPDRRPALDSALAQGLASGRYAVADAAELAQRIDADLKRVGRDRHLNFSFNPQQAAVLAAKQNETAPDPRGFQRQVRRANHGVTELRVLPGNIRYMAYDGFMWIGPESAAALDNAVRFLSGGDAIIIDLRRNRGGDADASQYLISHFLPADKPLYTYYEEGTSEPARIATLSSVPAGRVAGKPLYLLTSGGTASAAEEFTGNFRGYGLGEVIGETTAGAGYAADLVPIDGRFVLSISTGRVVLASTGRDWEAVGIAPTVRITSNLALDRAQVLALERIAAHAPAEDRLRLLASAEGLAAKLDPRSPALPLSAYVGSFGDRMLLEEESRLYYQRGSSLRIPLIPLGGNRFALENDPAQRLEFVQSANGIKAVAIRRPDGSVQGTYEKTSSGPSHE